MAETKIEWADYTFNPWMGCTKVSPACKNCYAERDFDHRYGKVKWGDKGTRVVTSDANWMEPLKWNRKAEATGTRPRVFCASLADVFEDWQGPMSDHHGKQMWEDSPNGMAGHVCTPTSMDHVRDVLFALIDATPHLDWLLLTKRPENIEQMWPINPRNLADGGFSGLGKARRNNVWLGTSVENQEYADKRIPELLGCRKLAPVLFLSCEPLLGKLDLTNWLEIAVDRDTGDVVQSGFRPEIDWVIAGGESGPGARPSSPGWFRSLRDQCSFAGVPFHFKQWGEWLPMSQFPVGSHDLRDVETVGPPNAFQARIGKKKAGRLLDGVAHDGFPVVEVK